jgi:protoporphyrinogen oxidase
VKNNDKHVVIAGAGPSGLAAAYQLCQFGVSVEVFEKDELVGGIARTAQHEGYRFDMGGHRFFTKVAEVNALWREVLGAQFLRRPRLSRIYYDGKYFQYPLKPWNALSGLGFYQAVRIGFSYLKWQARPHTKEETFEHWVTNRFGRRLFLIFFRAYTEKVWGIPCSELKAEWAAQRIKDLSLRSAVISMLFQPRKTITSLIEQFDYPRLGPGMMWEAVTDRVRQFGGSVTLEAPVVRFEREDMRVTAAVILKNGKERRVEGSDFISSMPITQLVSVMDPPPPPEVLEAASKLTYRSFLTVCLIVDDPDLFPDNWIYVHDPAVLVGRIQNYKNWSADMVPDPSKSGIGMEYFCDEGDELWCTDDAELIEMATREFKAIGLVDSPKIIDGVVYRVPKAYPVYDTDYAEYLTTLKDFVTKLENLQTIGRNGLHRYDNQDHAMMTGMMAARNIAHGETNDVWSVNTELDYHEELLEEVPVSGIDVGDIDTLQNNSSLIEDTVPEPPLPESLASPRVRL